ncbi:MAG: type II toxin-antitoxin system ParD family antitoxin [Spirulinaceae cyanobacterium]
MKITLTPAQQNFIQAKISTGKYQSTQQIIKITLRLFEEYVKTSMIDNITDNQAK